MVVPPSLLPGSHVWTKQDTRVGNLKKREGNRKKKEQKEGNERIICFGASIASRRLLTSLLEKFFISTCFRFSWDLVLQSSDSLLNYLFECVNVKQTTCSKWHLWKIIENCIWFCYFQSQIGIRKNEQRHACFSFQPRGKFLFHHIALPFRRSCVLIGIEKELKKLRFRCVCMCGSRARERQRISGLLFFS